MPKLVVWDMVVRLSCVVRTSTVVSESVLGFDGRDDADEILSVTRTAIVLVELVLGLVGRDEDVGMPLVV